MEVSQLNSSLIENIHFNDLDSSLTIKLKNSEDKYRYSDFTKEKFFEFIQAESIGSYFCKEIRNNYEYTKLNSEQ